MQHFSSTPLSLKPGLQDAYSLHTIICRLRTLVCRGSTLKNTRSSSNLPIFVTNGLLVDLSITGILNIAVARHAGAACCFVQWQERFRGPIFKKS